MRILKRREFLLCPAGTVFAKYESLGMLGTLSIKTDGPSPTPDRDDFVCMDLDGSAGVGAHGDAGSARDSDAWADLMFSAEEGARVDLLFDADCRDGCFEQDALFAVLDDDDVERLISVLKTRKDWA